MNIGFAIKTLRKEKNFKQGKFAEEAGISQTALSQIEKGQRKPSAQSLQKICTALNVPEAVLYVYAMEERDVPERKKEAFRQLFPILQSMIKEVMG